MKKDLLIAFLFAVTIVAVVGLGTYAASEEVLSQACRWERCGHINGNLENCEPEERGTLAQLVTLIQGTKSGAVRYSCGEGE